MGSVAFPRVINIEDLRRLARRRLPRVVFDYIDGGAEAEVTLRENCRAFEDIKFRPRGAVVVPECDLRTSVVGQALNLPLILAPIGSTRLFFPRGEELAAHAASVAGTAYTLSTLSGTRLEDVRAASTGPLWYQVYLCGGRSVAEGMLERVRLAGFTALVVTIDTAVPGMRERDFRNGIRQLLGGGPSMLPHLGQILTHPRWLAGLLSDGGLMAFPNVVLPDGPMAYADVGRVLEQSSVSWDDMMWIREHWTGPILVKGIHTALGGHPKPAINRHLKTGN